jgi:hypothetical protein
MRLPLLTLLLATLPAAAADWKPAPAPLMTRWGKQISADKQPWPEYPRPQLVRKDWLNLNGLWEYAITPRSAGKPEAWDGKILVPFCVESALSGVGKPVGKDKLLWYRTNVAVPDGWKGRRVLLHFQAVDWETTVYVNGQELGTHRGMSDPFSFDVTDTLKDGKGEVVVKVWDPTDDGAQPRGKQVNRPEGIWYTPVTGIWQTVWMEPVAEAYIARLHIAPDVDAGTVTVRVEGPGIRAGDTIDVIHQIDFETTDARRQPADKPVTLKVPNPRLWSPDSPRLYNASVVLTRGDRQLEVVTSYFAMRKIAAAKDEHGVMRLMLNNKPLFQIGPLDQGWWPDGLLTPPSDEAMKYDLEVLKKLGMNMLRKHIKVEPARLYRHCDELGLLVWQDMPSMMQAGRRHQVQPDEPRDVEFTAAEKAQFRAELKAMIDHLRPFPCIVAWVPFNEGWGQHDTNDVLKWVKEYDPSRLVNGPSGWTDRGWGDMKDMHNYPGPGMFPVMPDRVSVLGEFGGLGLPVKGHLWKDQGNWGYRTYRTTEELREGYGRLMHRLHPLIGRGLAAAVYTQTTDVEVEVNGFLTYDREVLKLDAEETARWHKMLFGPAPEFREVVPTSEREPQEWRYTTDKPADGWEAVGFADAGWKTGPGGFGTKGTPAAVIGTEWTTKDIWLRRVVELKEAPTGQLYVRVHHDEDADVFINGVPAASVPGYVTGYYEVPVRRAAAAALKPGRNVIAVHCRQTGGGQYIDVGLSAAK